MAAYKAKCLPALEKCTTTTGENSQCSAAGTACGDVDSEYSAYYPSYDPYDIRQPASSPFPPETYATYLQEASVVKAIGAKSTYTECSDSAGAPFDTTGDCMQSTSLTLNISLTISSGAFFFGSSVFSCTVWNYDPYLGG